VPIDWLESKIKAEGGAVAALYAAACATANPWLAAALTSQAREAAARVAQLVAMRSPETVRRMERERGLA